MSKQTRSPLQTVPLIFLMPAISVILAIGVAFEIFHKVMRKIFT